jgi:alkylated DNA nucleotide flippase Atl1
MSGSNDSARRERIIARIRSIPEGFVSTYGDIDSRAPRLVGSVLSAYAGDELPWHRVVRADGSPTQGAEQLSRLMDEGVPMRGERVDLRKARFIQA